VAAFIITLKISFVYIVELEGKTMPRYDDKYNTRLYVGRLSHNTRSRDLERAFSRYGR